MALHAVANCRRMHRQSGLNLLVVVAAQAESLRRSVRELYPSHVASHADFVAAQASGGNGGMYRFAFTLVFVAFQALLRVDVFIERYWMGLGPSRCNRHEKKEKGRLQKTRAERSVRHRKDATWKSRDHCQLGTMHDPRLPSWKRARFQVGP